MKTLTIYDIARMAKVSRSTVSRVLNNSENVSDEVRERVLKVIRETNYEPNVRARSLTVKKANTIAVIHMAGRKWIENIESNPFYSEVMQGILREAMHYRYMVSQFMIMKESDLENILKMVRGRAIDGLALVGHFHPELINRLSEERLPLVLIDNDLPEMEISSVCSDNKTGITLAMEYLLNLGHSRIGYISGPLERFPYQQRFLAYKEALENNEILYDESIVSIGDATGDQLISKLLAARPFPTAILASNDDRILEAAVVLKKAGLKIPEDVSIFGYDDIYAARLLEVGLSTISVPREQIGREGVRLLAAAIQNPNSPVQKKVLHVQMILRGSVAIPKEQSIA